MWVLLDENLSWKEHIKYNENKIAKNLGLLFKAKHYLNKRSLLVLYYSFIHTYINYGNIAWRSTNITNLDPNLVGFFRGLFWGGWEDYPLFVKVVRIILETWNLVRKYAQICSFRKFTFYYRDSLDFADGSAFLQKISIFWQK